MRSALSSAYAWRSNLFAHSDVAWPRRAACIATAVPIAPGAEHRDRGHARSLSAMIQAVSRRRVTLLLVLGSRPSPRPRCSSDSPTRPGSPSRSTGACSRAWCWSRGRSCATGARSAGSRGASDGYCWPRRRADGALRVVDPRDRTDERCRERRAGPDDPGVGRVHRAPRSGNGRAAARCWASPSRWRGRRSSWRATSVRARRPARRCPRARGRPVRRRSTSCSGLTSASGSMSSRTPRPPTRWPPGGSR